MQIHERKALARQYLKPGDVTLIAKNAECSIQSVSEYINGHVANSLCEPFFKALIIQRKAESKTKINNMLAEASQATDQINGNGMQALEVDPAKGEAVPPREDSSPEATR